MITREKIESMLTGSGLPFEVRITGEISDSAWNEVWYDEQDPHNPGWAYATSDGESGPIEDEADVDLFLDEVRFLYGAAWDETRMSPIYTLDDVSAQLRQLGVEYTTEPCGTLDLGTEAVEASFSVVVDFAPMVEWWCGGEMVSSIDGADDVLRALRAAGIEIPASR